MVGTSVNVVDYNPTGQRKMRRPEHRFQLRTRPWQIQPFLLAPVLPGETMKNLLMQARVVTDPVLNPLIGWWAEHYFFYVKHRDLHERDLLTQMVLDPSTDLSSIKTAANAKTYHALGGIDWASLCLRRVVEEFFRDEGEVWNTEMIDGLPLAQVSMPGWLDSVINDADYSPAGDIDLDANADSKITASEVEAGLAHWQFMRQYGLTEMSYEDYLQSYGVRRPRVELHRPELLRYTRNWTYPAATVNPADGKPSSAAVWSVAERADKDRFFSEPGFVFGVSVTRPKVYFSKQAGSATDFMTSAFSWLPATMTNDMGVSRLKLAATSGLLTLNADAYWIDVRDILMYGDQFVNFSLASTDAGFVALPTAGLKKKYVSGTDCDALFTYASADPARKEIRQDGVVSLGILSQQRDVS